MVRTHRLIYLLLSFLALFAGVLCYYFFRNFNPNMIFFKLIHIKITHATIPLPDNFIAYFLKYNLNDGLWLLSGILFFRFVWFNNSKTGDLYVIIFICIALLLQLLKLIKRFPGTFDIFDIITMASFALLEHYLNLRFKKGRRTGCVKER